MTDPEARATAPETARNRPRRSAPGMFRAAVLGLLLGLHFFTRLHAQQVTPLAERHFYPESYFVSLSLMQGGGFRYLLPADAVGPAGHELELVLAPPGPSRDDPRSAVLGFIRLTGTENIPPAEMQRYVAAGTSLVDPDPVEGTRVFDIHLAALLWRAFGISWSVYFAFYALVSTLACFCVFFVARTATGSFWFGLVAAAGFLGSPLELYSGAWSTRDTAPLWFGAVALAALAGFPGRDRGPGGAVLGGLAVGFASLLGLGWRADAQLVPPLVLAGLVLTLARQSRARIEWVLALGGFVAGCSVVLFLVHALGPGSYSQGGTVFHTAWYGEAARSNKLQVENAFQVARDDYLTLYQANYYARGRYGSSPEGAPSSNTKDLRHYRRCREMYLEMVRYNAASLWSTFPSFLARSAGLDHPTLLGSDAEAADFLARRPTVMKVMQDGALGRYGATLPWLILAGLVGGLMHRGSHAVLAVVTAYFVCYAAAVLLVLPEPKQMTPLLLPVHVLGALGVWSLARATGFLRSRAEGRWTLLQEARMPAAICAAAVLAWGGLGFAAHVISRQQRARFVDAIRVVAGSGRETPLGGKRFSTRVDGGSIAPPTAYVLRVRASSPAHLLLVHVRASTPERFLAYYSRHPVEPGEERYFFFNVVAGRDVGETRPYAAHVRVVGAAELVSIRTADLSRWPLGLPLSFVFDAEDAREGGTRVGRYGAATEGLPTPAEVHHLLEEPRAFLRSYQPE